MRNGNVVEYRGCEGKQYVLILPMRNGNLFSVHLFSQSFARSYPTYEEWKHSILRKVEMLENSSYPTYEEWKLYQSEKFLESCFVLILPMRNGNVDKTLYELADEAFLSYL